jgi:hypothetical protein
MAVGIFGTSIRQDEAASYEIEQWKLEGSYVLAGPAAVTFASAGAATSSMEFQESGSYVVGVRARGTPCRGEYPIAQFSVDGHPIALVQLDSEAWKVYAAPCYVEKGRRTFAVAFINDASNPPAEDRNLEIDKVLVARDDSSSNSVLLTTPPAAIAVRVDDGTVVFDLVQWDTAESHTRQAARYACSLATLLDANMTPRSMVAVECDQMTPQPDMKFFSNKGGVAAMNCSGYIKTTIDVATSRQYAIEIVASGTPAQGIYPLVEMQIDGRNVGQVQLTTGGWRAYPITARLEAGRHELALFFVNDGTSPSGEDRNLKLDKVIFYNQ